MREIEFRAMNLDGKLVYGVTNLNAVGIVKNTLEQYTGLKDMNGKKIFDGDIVQSKEVILGVVEYFGREAAFAVGNQPLQAFVYGSALPENHKMAYVELEVIGNIHEEVVE